MQLSGIYCVFYVLENDLVRMVYCLYVSMFPKWRCYRCISFTMLSMDNLFKKVKLKIFIPPDFHLHTRLMDSLSTRIDLNH